jgi:nucleoside phosphorylase/CheY-like chemotaxis protein
MQVLVVDDDYGKVREIATALEQAGVRADVIQETTAHAARKRLRSETYDLLLIDLNLPSTAGAPPTSDGGLEFFDLLVLDAQVEIPGEVLFITAEEGLVAAGRLAVEQRGGSLCAFSTHTSSWKPVVIGKAKLATRRGHSAHLLMADVCILTALGAPELDQVLDLPYGWQPLRLPGDPTLYFKGQAECGGRSVSVVAASAMKKGMASSAAVATKLVLKFRPTLMLMTGICAGVKERTTLGDVVAADPCWDWGSGKHAETEDGSPVFKMSPVQRPLNTALAGLCSEIGRSAEFKSRVRAGWAGKLPEGEFHCHIGPMASGASVVADRSTAALIGEQNRDLIAIEMEAFAVMAACEYAASPAPLGLAIKSVCDYADSEKSDDWQKYAAYTSAMFADELIRRCCADDVGLARV